MHRVLLLSLCCAISGSVVADDEGSATYLANQGILVEFGDDAVLFDPLFDNDFGRFQRVPEDMQQALLDGEPPFDNVAAVFVSHYHGDHFSPGLMIEYLGRQPDVRLYGPVQATNALRQAAGADADILARVSGLALEHGDAPVNLRIGDLAISVVRLPHSGWPDRMTDIENLAFRVTLSDQVIVDHYGDADAKQRHFNTNAAYWSESKPALSMPPYWFLQSSEGRRILDGIVRPHHVVGTHVPLQLPNRPALVTADGEAYDLFRKPGEQRPIRLPE